MKHDKTSNESEAIEGTPKYPILSKFDPPLAEDQIAVFRKIATVLARAAIQATDQGGQKRVIFSEERKVSEVEDDQNRNL